NRSTRLCHEPGIDGIHEAGTDLTDRSAEHAEDGDGDEQADDRVGPLPAESDSADAEEDGEAGEAVGAGVQVVGDEGGGSDAAPDPDAVLGDDLVPGEADHGGGGDPPEIVD